MLRRKWLRRRRGNAHDLFLTHTLRHARVLRAPASPTVVDAFIGQRAEVATSVKQQLQKDAGRIAGLRLLPGRFMVINQAMGMPIGRSEEAFAFLSAFMGE